MAEVVRNSVNKALSPVKEDTDPNTDHVTALLHRRIEFHLERKPFKGFSDEGNNGFKLETLNPSSSDYSNKSDPHKSISGAVSGSGKVLEGSNYGLDPELSFKISFRRIGAGLQNLGNTCFLNSVLQCLTYTEPLAAYLQSGRHKISCRAAGFCALCAIQKHVSRALESTGRILVPKDLVSNLRCISRNFRNARQEDAHEYMVNLLESMHKCCIPSGVPSESPSAYEKSLVHMIFGGRLRSQVKCLQCSFCSNKFDPFLDLSLEIVKADSLSKALANFTAQEHLDGGERQYQCQQCKQKVRALKQLTVHKAPEVLTIHLKRFASHAPGVKIDKKIDFPTALDLKRYVTGPHDGNLNYTLYGVLVHAGWSTHSGHYYCFVRTSSGMWYCLDDNQVVQVSEGKVLQQKAYMLFYVRDRRNSVPKKTVDVLQRDNVVMKALGNKVCNNFKLGLEEPNQSESIEKKSCDSVSCTVAQSLVSDTNLLNRSGMKTDSAPNVGGPSEKTSVSNSTLSMASEKVNGTHSIPNAPLSRVSERVNGTNPSGPGCSSLKKDHVTESSLKVPAVSSANGSPMPNVTAGSCLEKAVPFFHNALSLDKSVQNDHNKLKGSAKNSNDGVLQSSTSSWDANNGKDHNGAIDEYLNSVGLPRFCSGTSYLTSTTKTMQDGGVSEVAGASDLHSSMGSGSGQGEYKQPEPDLGRKSLEKKLHGVKKRAFKRQPTILRLSSSFTFGAALGRRKKHKRGRKHSMAKVDVESVPSDTGPSTSKKAEIVHNICSAHSPKGKKVDASTKLIGSSVIDEDSRKTVKQSRNSTAKPLLQKTSASATGQLPDLRESSGPEHLGTVHAKTDTMSMAVGGLNDVPVPRWDGLEPFGPSDCLESGLADGVSIGYVADEWDEQYDCGKRKKVRQSKLAFDGYNPFQEIASRRSKTKKAKRDNYRSAPQPFRK